MDYYQIGQRIRKYRKALGLSQDALAERIGISTTHMSHIETGNTKLSLQVFADIAAALDVRADELLYDAPASGKAIGAQQIADVLSRCTPAQTQVLADILTAAKQGMDKHLG